ncbi:MAG: phosphatase PAP2 family protein [Sphingorhabdus sp.]
MTDRLVNYAIDPYGFVEPAKRLWRFLSISDAQGCDRRIRIASFVFMSFSLLAFCAALIISSYSGFYVDPETSKNIAILVGFTFFAGALLTTRAELYRIGHFIVLFGVLASIAASSVLFSFAIMALGIPMKDAMLADIDTLLFYDWMAVMRWVMAYPLLVDILSFCYSLLGHMDTMLLASLCMMGRFRDAYIFATAWIISIVVVLCCFIYFPAYSAFHHYGVIEEMQQSLWIPSGWSHIAQIDAVRSGGYFDVFANFNGIVTFPSFHACAGMLLAYGFWQIPYLRYPFALANVLMILATPVIGAHYLIDTIAGTLVALLSIALARRILIPRDERMTLPFSKGQADPKTRSAT